MAKQIGILIPVLVFFVGFSAWVYQTALIPPPPIRLGSPDGPPITSPRIKLRDGRHLSYVESGVPKDAAKAKIIYLHGLAASKYHHPFAVKASPGVVEELGVYVVSIDRPGYGESDPDPNRTLKSFALDIEDFADKLNLGEKFYVVGYSMGGLLLWPCLKYIPHRLAGAVLIAPAINYWWPNLPSNLTNEAFSRKLPRDQWTLGVVHHLPWLTWITQKWFPSYSSDPPKFSRPDMEVMSNLFSAMEPHQLQMMKSLPRQQGDFESLHRDLIIGFGKWDFDPMDLENPFPNNEGSVHLWMGDDNDLQVPVTLQRYIAQQLGWIKYHEVAGAGHMFGYADGVIDNILKELLNVKNS